MRLLYFSPVQWHSYFQRPHYMIRYFLEKNSENTVLWINPYPTRFPNRQDLFRLRFRGKDDENKKNNRVKIISPKALPIEPLYHSAKINHLLFWKKHWKKIEDFCSESNTGTIIGIGRPSKFALSALEKLKHQSSFYDAMDDFPEFYSGFSRQSMLKVEKSISERVEKIFVSSTTLFEKFSNGHSNKSIKVLNGYDMTSLPAIIDPGLLRSATRREVRNDDGAAIIFGFVGTIGQWFDWPVVIALAKQFPEAIVRLVGPQYVKYSGVLPKNIEIFPECTQPDAINYVSQFHIGLIPFKQNALTQSVDPIKYYEYRAMGLPVLSTRFGEMLHRKYEDGVYFFDDSDINKLFLYQDNTQKTTAFRKENDWKTRFSLCEFSP